MEPIRYAAFTADPNAGNPAGVVLADAFPSDDAMQQLATEIGYSETAFVVHTGNGRYRVRYFSPAAEVDFCGHATIALGVALGESGLSSAHLDTNVGAVPLEIRTDPIDRVVVTLSAAKAAAHPIDAYQRRRLIDMLALEEADLEAAYPIAIGDSGNLHPVVVLRDRSRLAALDYDFDSLRDLSVEQRWVTVQIVCADAPDKWSSRNPFPFGGVREDPATGSAAIALGAYLRDFGFVDVPTVVTIEQGRDMGRPSLLTVSIDGPGPAVRVSGTAVRIPGAGVSTGGDL